MKWYNWSLITVIKSNIIAFCLLSFNCKVTFVSLVWKQLIHSIIPWTMPTGNTGNQLYQNQGQNGAIIATKDCTSWKLTIYTHGLFSISCVISLNCLPALVLRAATKIASHLPENAVEIFVDGCCLRWRSESISAAANDISRLIRLSAKFMSTLFHLEEYTFPRSHFYFILALRRVVEKHLWFCWRSSKECQLIVYSNPT